MSGNEIQELSVKELDGIIKSLSEEGVIKEKSCAELAARHLPAEERFRYRLMAFAERFNPSMEGEGAKYMTQKIAQYKLMPYLTSSLVRLVEAGFKDSVRKAREIHHHKKKYESVEESWQKEVNHHLSKMEEVNDYITQAKEDARLAPVKEKLCRIRDSTRRDLSKATEAIETTKERLEEISERYQTAEQAVKRNHAAYKMVSELQLRAA